VTVKDVFGLIVRTAGLSPILYGLFYAISAVFSLLGLSTHPEITFLQTAAAAGSYFALGIVIIVLADPITRLIYGRDK